MVVLPAEWQTNKDNINSSKDTQFMNENVSNTQKERIIARTSPIITVPEISNKNTMTKNFTHNVDEEFKTRSSQLPNSNFKDMRPLISVNKDEISGHFLPGYVYSKNDLHERPREFATIRKKNEFGFDRTANKPITVRKINPQDVVNSAVPKNKFNYVYFDSARESGGKTPILPVLQERQKIIVKK